jgi:hypothetical protein
VWSDPKREQAESSHPKLAFLCKGQTWKVLGTSIWFLPTKESSQLRKFLPNSKRELARLNGPGLVEGGDGCGGEALLLFSRAS